MSERSDDICLSIRALMEIQKGICESAGLPFGVDQAMNAVEAHVDALIEEIELLTGKPEEVVLVQPTEECPHCGDDDWEFENDDPNVSPTGSCNSCGTSGWTVEGAVFDTNFGAWDVGSMPMPQVVPGTPAYTPNAVTIDTTDAEDFLKSLIKSNKSKWHR
jgi:hypothetical protein